MFLAVNLKWNLVPPLTNMLPLICHCSGNMRLVAAENMAERCSVARWAMGHERPKILVGWATVHLAPPIIGLHVH